MERGDVLMTSRGGGGIPKEIYPRRSMNLHIWSVTFQEVEICCAVQGVLVK